MSKREQLEIVKVPPSEELGRFIQNKIYEVRGQKVMLDFDLAQLYEVETRILNQAIKRNLNSFPENFMFRLTKEEWENLTSQIVMSSWGGRRNLPYAFTEHGVTMLASVLKSLTARKMNIAIVRTFIAMRKMISQYSEVIKVIDELKNKIDGHDIQLNQIYDALEEMLDKKAEEENTKENWENRERIGFKK